MASPIEWRQPQRYQLSLWLFLGWPQPQSYQLFPWLFLRVAPASELATLFMAIPMEWLQPQKYQLFYGYS